MSPHTLDWFGCATFRRRTSGLTVMLDAYIDRPDTAARPLPRQTADAIDTADRIIIADAPFEHP